MNQVVLFQVVDLLVDLMEVVMNQEDLFVEVDHGQVVQVVDHVMVIHVVVDLVEDQTYDISTIYIYIYI